MYGLKYLPSGPLQKIFIDPCLRRTSISSSILSLTTTPLQFKAGGGSLWRGMWPARHSCQSVGPLARLKPETVDQALIDVKWQVSSCCSTHCGSLPTSSKTLLALPLVPVTVPPEPSTLDLLPPKAASTPRVQPPPPHL